MKVVINQSGKYTYYKWYDDKNGQIIDVDDFVDDLYILSKKRHLLIFKEDTTPISMFRKQKLKRILKDED